MRTYRSPDQLAEIYKDRLPVIKEVLSKYKGITDALRCLIWHIENPTLSRKGPETKAFYDIDYTLSVIFPLDFPWDEIKKELEIQ